MSKQFFIMGKIREMWNGPHRSFIRYATFATGLFLLIVGFFGEDNLVRWAKAGIELRQQQRQIEFYKTEIADMEKRLQKLSTDVDSLEEFARYRFHFAAPDDDVYLLGTPEYEKQEITNSSSS